MNDAFKSMIYNGALIYIDDVLLYGRTPEELMQRIFQFLTICDNFDIKISVKKSNWFCEKVKWCGKIITADGISHDPDRVAALSNMPMPKDGGELYQFVSAAGWMRSHIPWFSHLSQPLWAALIKIKTYLGKPAANKAACAKVELSEKVGWDDTCKKAFTTIKNAIARATKLAHPDPDKEFLVFTDASGHHWGALITQVTTEAWVKFLGERALSAKKTGGRQVFHIDASHLDALADLGHEPLVFLSAEFKNAQVRWAAPEREAYAVRTTLLRCFHLLMRTKGSTVLTDHKNLEFLLTASISTPLPSYAADKIYRWHVAIMSLPYNILYVAGQANLWADMMSRWCAYRLSLFVERPVVGGMAKTVR
eukprot:GHVU01113815.1.p1 GENE.GHVU01113815.1~~GHVU01113815.1.p1  ORF type:complete len:414 (+),score=39.27 GHVU01113815.1:150-1244(+)